MKDESYISSPRPMWNKEEGEETRNRRSITLGSNTSGIVICVTKKGIEFNGYYAGLIEQSKFANLREFITVSWDDFDKMRADAFLKKPVERKREVRDPDEIDNEPDMAYLETLPVVTLNGKKYFIDAAAQQRRPVDKPEQVFDFETQAARKPS